MSCIFLAVSLPRETTMLSAACACAAYGTNKPYLSGRFLTA